MTPRRVMKQSDAVFACAHREATTGHRRIQIEKNETARTFEDAETNGRKGRRNRRIRLKRWDCVRARSGMNIQRRKYDTPLFDWHSESGTRILMSDQAIWGILNKRIMVRSVFLKVEHENNVFSRFLLLAHFTIVEEEYFRRGTLFHGKRNQNETDSFIQ